MASEIKAGLADARRTPRKRLAHLGHGDIFYKLGYLLGWIGV